MPFKQQTLHYVYLIFSWLALNACGGSGSSGFDTSSATSLSFDSEQSAILQVTQEGGCVETEDTKICAAIDPLEVGADTPPTTTTPINSPLALSITPPSRTTISCILTLGQASCDLKILVTVSGFLANTHFIPATRLGPSASWAVGPAFSRITSEGLSPLEAIIQFGVSEIEANQELQIAILIYDEGADLPQVGTQESLLSRFGANPIFVATDVMLSLRE